MKKLWKWLVLAVVAIVVIVAVAVYLNLNGIVRRTVETQTTKSLDLQTNLGSAAVSIFGGQVSLNDLAIASPPGFAAPQMFALDGVSVDVSYGELRNDPIRVRDITIERPKLVLERQGGKFNIQYLVDKAGQTPPEPEPAEGETMRLVIDRLQVTNATVEVRPGIPGIAPEISVMIPPLELKNIGTGEGAQNGVAIREVATKVISAMAEKAAQSDQIPEQLRQVLALDTEQLKAAVEQRVTEEIDKVRTDLTDKINKELPPELGGLLKSTTRPAATQDAGKAVQDGLRGLLKREEKK